MRTKINKQPITIKGGAKNVPKEAVNVYSRVPVEFQTKEQYVKELIKNQEKVRGIDFTDKQEKEFKKTELEKMKNVVARYTTKNNPYMPTKTVFFTDDKISPEKLKEMARHENNHYAWEPFDSDKGSKNMTLGPKRYGPRHEHRTVGMRLGPKRYGMRIKPVDPNVIKIGPKRMNLNSDFVSRNMKFKSYKCTQCGNTADWPYDPSEKQKKCLYCSNNLWDKV